MQPPVIPSDALWVGREESAGSFRGGGVSGALRIAGSRQDAERQGLSRLEQEGREWGEACRPQNLGDR